MLGVEGNGPSEEDLKIREGEPEGRVQDVEDAHERANASEGLRAEADKKYAEASQKRKDANRNDDLQPYGGMSDSSTRDLRDSADKASGQGDKLMGQAGEVEEHGIK